MEMNSELEKLIHPSHQYEYYITLKYNRNARVFAFCIEKLWRIIGLIEGKIDVSDIKSKLDEFRTDISEIEQDSFYFNQRGDEIRFEKDNEKPIDRSYRIKNVQTGNVFCMGDFLHIYDELRRRVVDFYGLERK